MPPPRVEQGPLLHGFDLLSQFLTRIVYGAFAPVCKSTGGLSTQSCEPMLARAQGSSSIYWTRARLVGRNGLVRPGRSKVDLFRYGQGIINLNTEILDGAFDLGVAEQ